MCDHQYGLISSPASSLSSSSPPSIVHPSPSFSPSHPSSSLRSSIPSRRQRFIDYAAAAQSRPVSYERLQKFIDKKPRAPWRVLDDIKHGKSSLLPPASLSSSDGLSSSSAPLPPSLFPTSSPSRTLLNSITPYSRFDHRHTASSLMDLETFENGGYSVRDFTRRDLSPFIFGGVIFEQIDGEKKISEEHHNVLQQRKRNKDARRQHLSDCESLHFSVISKQATDGEVRERKDHQRKMPAYGCRAALESTFSHLFEDPPTKEIKPRHHHWEHQKRATALWDHEGNSDERINTAPITINNRGISESNQTIINNSLDRPSSVSFSPSPISSQSSTT